MSVPAERRAASAQVFVESPTAPVLDPRDLHHLGRVLRLADGEHVVAADGAGGWTLCAFRTGRGPESALEVLGQPGQERRPLPALTVAFAPAKGDRPEWVVQKLAELGVDRIVPLEADRSVVRWGGERSGRAVERLRRVARAAAAQSRQVWISEVAEVATPASLAAAIPVGSPAPALADPDGGPLTLATPSVAVGPEGGWSEQEQALGWPRVSLGPGVLRAETAAVAAGAILGALRAGTVATGMSERSMQ